MEKKEPRGKSSILKPQKTRKPFEDLELGNEVPDDLTNMDKTERRVSFASSNFVKPFIADPEKNTIWDSTYEEAVESLGSPQDVKNSNQMGFDSTEMEFTTIDIETVENNNCVDMEFTGICETEELNTTAMKSTIPINIVEDNNGASMELTTTHINAVENNCMGTISADMELITPVSTVLRDEDKSEPNDLEMSAGLSCDDTEKLINYNVSNVKASDFSKVITGDLDPSFLNLPKLPLRGINSTSFVQDLTNEDQENVSLLCDTTAPFISDSSLSIENIDSVDCDSADNFDILDILSSIDDLKIKLYELDKRNDRVEKLVEDIAPKVCKELEEGVAAREKQMQEFSRMNNLLKEFFNKRTKQENTPLPKTQVNLDKCSNNEPEKLTWKDRILKSYKGNEEYWSMISLDGSLYQFSTLYETIEFSVQLNEENGHVLDMQLRSRADYEKTPPIALYTHKVFMEKLELKHIQSALGSKFEILSLLDYVRLTMEKIVEMDQEFALLEIMHGVTMDRDFKISFALISVKCMFSWMFTIDVADYNHIDGDKL
ncbi:hypothetical protein Trydic_g19661 [Trypoxylus dichotomus]